MKKRTVLNSPRLLALKKKRRRGLQSKILLLILAFFILFTSLVFIFRIDKLNIETITIAGNKVVDTELIEEVIQDNLKGYYLYFLPKSNFLLFPENKIENELAAKFGRLKDISISLGGSKTLSVSLTEREGKYIWCGENLPDAAVQTNESLCYFMDDSGYIFDAAPYFSGSVYFKFFGPLDLNETGNPLGTYFAPEIFDKLVAFKDALISMNIKPVFVLVKNEDIEIYLSSNVVSVDAPKIIFKSDFELEKLSENLQTALATEPLKSNFKNKYSSLSYIDLRFGNKVYFKFR